MKLHYLYYKDRPEWADVVPVPQDEGDKNIVRIAYSPEFVDANDYMRAVLLKDERSERALEITATVLQLNPANYTVWEYRRRILESLEANLLEELQFVSRLIGEHSKNYQLWHHRQWITSRLAEKPIDQNVQLVPEELRFIEQVIAEDSKNYHAWQYRRWLVENFKIPAITELNFTEMLIREDMYNNSAWNHRFVTATKTLGLTPAVLDQELEFVQGVIRSAPNNESSWNYLYGLLVPAPTVVAGSNRSAQSKQLSSRPDLVCSNTSYVVVDETRDSDQETKLVIHPPLSANLRVMRSFAEDLAKSNAVAADSVALLGFLVEVYTDCIQVELSSKVVEQESGFASESISSLGDPEPPTTTSVPDLVELAVSTCERLATELDRIRATYWRYRSRQIQALACEANQQS